jgi:hypothetical protein
MNKIFILILFLISLSFSMNSIEKTDKYSLLKTFPNKYVPTVELYDKNTDLEYINYPVIFKTNKCSFFGYDVKKIKNSNEAIDYINKFKYDKNDIIIQEFSPFNNEIAIFLKRNVLDNKLEVYSGVIREIKKDSLVNNKCEKGKCKIVTDELSDILKNKIIEITERVKGFNWGRYDIKYESFERLNIGEFHIIELNGDTQGLIPIIYPMNFDLAVYWSNNNIILSIYKLIEIIFYYYALCIKNLIMGKTGISDILMNINKWINNLKCY